jgi:hypothetical protein
MSAVATSKENPTTYEYDEEYHPPFLLALIVFPPAAPFFWGYHVKVSESTLSVGYSVLFRREIERKLIQKAEKIDHISGLSQWGGWGYRLSWKLDEVGYITKNGPGIRLTFKEAEDGKDKVIVFNCDDAEKVCRMLNTPVLNAVVH